MDIIINDVLPVQSVTNIEKTLEREVLVAKEALDAQKAEGQSILELLASITQKGQSIDLKV